MLRVLQLGIWWKGKLSGGLDRVHANLVDRLPAAGVDVRALVRGPDGSDQATDGRVTCFAAPNANLLGQAAGIRHAVRKSLSEFCPHAIGVHFAFHAAMAGRVLRKKPLVVHFHGPWSQESAQEGARSSVVMAKRMVEQSVYRKANRVIVLSEAFGELISREFGVSEQRIRLVPGHVDLQRFMVAESKAEARQRLGWPFDRPILISVRRLTQRMGLERLVSAIQHLITVVPDVLLFVAGVGGLAEKLRAQVETLGLQQHIRFLGFVPDEQLPLVYRAADINVVPTLALEGFGLVAAEALAAGTPSMVAPVGGLPEVVKPLSESLIFTEVTPAGLGDQLAAALRGTISLPSADHCRTYAAAHFSSDLAAQRTAAVYRDLVENG